jgi:hypothetical protein
MRAETMRAGQVDELDDAVISPEGADMLFDGDARVITDALSQARQAIEQCAFARIGATDNRNAGSRLPAYGNV